MRMCWALTRGVFACPCWCTACNLCIKVLCKPSKRLRVGHTSCKHMCVCGDAAADGLVCCCRHRQPGRRNSPSYEDGGQRYRCVFRHIYLWHHIIMQVPVRLQLLAFMQPCSLRRSCRDSTQEGCWDACMHNVPETTCPMACRKCRAHTACRDGSPAPGERQYITEFVSSGPAAAADSSYRDSRVQAAR